MKLLIQNVFVFINVDMARWYSGMILAKGVRGPGSTPGRALAQFFSLKNLSIEYYSCNKNSWQGVCYRPFDHPNGLLV